MKKLDKKQVPQFVALCILTVGVFGWFAVKMIIPTPAAAQSGRPAPTVQRVASATHPADQTLIASVPAQTNAVAGILAPTDSVILPSAATRDPFIAANITTPVASTAPKPAPAAPAATLRMAARLSAPPALPLPMGLGSFPGVTPGFANGSQPVRGGLTPLPVTISPPAWTVTGVLQSDDEKVAILRNGASRRIVHTGDMVDSLFRVVSVTRTSVVLRHGEKQYHLILGGLAPAPAATITTPASALPSWFPSGQPAEAAPTPGIVAPSVPSTPLVAVPAFSALRNVYSMTLHAARLALLPLQMPTPKIVPAADISAFSPSHLRGVGTPPKWAQFHLASAAIRPTFGDARAHVELGIALYQSGKRAEGRNEWQKVLIMDDFDAADEAGKMLYRYQ